MQRDRAGDAGGLQWCETKYLRAEPLLLADGGFAGYASVFGKVDLAGDMVKPGAFAASLRRRGTAGIRLLFQHDPAEPLGVFEDIREDAVGLRVRGRLMPDVARAREVLSLMRAGALDGLSIGFRTVRARTDAKTGVRHLLEIDLWEISIVTFPMLAEARIASVKGGVPPQAARLAAVLAAGAAQMRRASGSMPDAPLFKSSLPKRK